MLDQIYEPQLAKLSYPGQETINDQVHRHADMNLAAQGTAAEQVPLPLQMYIQATVVQQLQARQEKYLSMYVVLSGVWYMHAKDALAYNP